MNTLEVMRRVLTAYDTHDLLGMEAHMQDLRRAIEQAEKQESYWQEEARRYAGNADFWREKAKRQPLTDEEIDKLAVSMVKGDKSVNWLARAIERKHGIGGGE
jgi:predicted RNase H-like nuclease (RuvC/YqgF family)